MTLSTGPRPKLLKIGLLALAFGGATGIAHADKVEIRWETKVNDEELVSKLRDALADETPPETLFGAKRQNERAANALREVLNSEGYYDPSIETLIETDPNLSPVLKVDIGERFTIASRKVRYGEKKPREADMAALEEAFTLEPGSVAYPTEVIDQERVLLRELRKLGYAFASARDRTIIGDRDAAQLEIIYNIVPGPRVRFGEIIYPDDIRTRETYLERLEAFEPGDLFDPAQLALFSARLDETRLFDLANARLSEDPAGETDQGDVIHDVVVSLKERDRNTIAAGASFATDTGFGLNAEFTRRNLTRRGDLLITSVNLAELEQFVDVQWRRPNEFGYGRGLVFSTRLANEETDGFDRQAFSVGAGYEVVEGPNFSYGYGVTGSLVHEKDDFGERDLQLLGLYANARLDRADSIINPTRGWRADGRIEPNVSFGGAESQFLRAETQLRGYYPFGDKLVMAGRFKVGTVYGADIEMIPSTKRFFAGGGGSVRGYAYQAIGPRSDENAPLGGRGLLETSVEARYQIRNKIGIAAFVDGGSVSTSEVPSFGDLRLGAGLGVRYDTPAGPLRIDVATPLDPTDNDDPVQVYISLGQAF